MSIEFQKCKNLLARHAGLEEPAPHLIRGHPETLKKAGFLPEIIPVRTGAGMTNEDRSDRTNF
jgi:hypothetical protein